MSFFVAFRARGGREDEEGLALIRFEEELAVEVQAADPVAYAPLGHGSLTGAVRSVCDLPAHDFRRTSPRFAYANLERNLPLLDRIIATADSLGVTSGQLALAWVLARDGVTAVPGTKRRTWLEQDVAAAGIALDDATIAGLSAAIPVGAAAGDRYAPMGMASVQE
ncbi:aldo/keto reductase [Streptomyces sp. ActVer]|uniref:aldo/keto reductase n=1 Tax=Streptomyces sp. ActVer TaxID=3014558 RepID=UPI0022B53497|nr:aldo/keto reductase [Streptomyces sp. ActVer]MCZ4514371.1 aldo/keto reductase [Streptomyces sp. ActVer]